MKPATAGKENFLDGVVDDMGDGKGGTDYGADMDDDKDGVDPDAKREDGLMAASQVAKALGMPNANSEKLYDALKALISTC